MLSTLIGEPADSGIATNTHPDTRPRYGVRWTYLAGGTTLAVVLSFALTALPAAAASGVNQAPVLDPAKSPVLVPVGQDAGPPSGPVGTPVTSLVDFAVPAGGLDNVTDADSGALLGIAVTAADTGTGSWFYTLNNGTTWTPLGSVSATTARLLAADAGSRLYLQPAPGLTARIDAALTIRAWDRTAGTAGGFADTSNNGATAFSAATDTVSITVGTVNQAPVLDPAKSPVLVPVGQDAGPPSGPVGTPVTSLVDFAVPAGGLDNVTDADSGALLGIAVTAADTGSGSWFYTLNNGTTWTPLGSVSATTARLLAADAGSRLYLQPAPGLTARIDAALTIRAWDRTAGTAGGFADTSNNGGATAFSAATDTVSITVGTVNQAPVLDPAKSPVLVPVGQDAGPPSGPVGTPVTSLVDFAVPAGGLDNVTDADSGALLGIAVTAADTGSGSWFYTLNNGTTWTPLGSVSATTARLLAADAGSRLYLQPAPGLTARIDAALTIRAWDRTAGTAGGFADTSNNGGATAFSAATDTVSITVGTVNHAGADAYTTPEDTPLTVPPPGALSNDTDPDNDILTALLVTGPAHATSFTLHPDGSFSYVPAGNYNGPDSFTYKATDGNADSNVATVTLTVTSVNDILFASGRTGNGDVYVVDPSGDAPTQLTSGAAIDAEPVWSPDGTKIAFSSSRTGGGDIYTMNASGTSPTRLTTHSAADASPAWSPDGTKIAFASNRSGNWDLYLMNANGTAQTRLTTNSADDTVPTWSPDGTKIAFSSTRTGGGDIYVMNADGTGQTRLTTASGVDTEPAWSPDGTTIAFATNRNGSNNFEIYTMATDGTGQTRRTTQAGHDVSPAWSPDGTRIAFASNRTGNFDIYTMSATGTGQTAVVTHPAVDALPDW